MANSRENALGVFFLFLVALMWGFVASTVKRLTAAVDPYTISFFRVSLATAVFIAMFVLRRGKWKHLPWLLPWVIVGALGRAGNYLLYNRGLVDAPSYAVAILAPAQTICMIILAKWVIGERILPKWLGLTLSFAGLVLIWWNGQPLAVLLDLRHALSNLLFVAAGVASAFQFASTKVLSAEYSSLEILIPVFGISTLLTVPFAWNAGGFVASYSLGTWGLVALLGFIITGGSFFFLAEGYKRCSATTAVVITNSNIFLTLLVSRFLMHEGVSGIMVAGAVLGVAGAIAVVQAERQQVRQAELATAN